MNASRVAALCAGFEAAGIVFWIDGGWGVDALLGRQTREHGDLDIVVEEHRVTSLRAMLEARGFRDADRQNTRPWNFVLEDGDQAAVDVHVIRMDPDGNGVYGPAEKGDLYPAHALTGRGTIGGRPVRCMTPDYQIRNRTGYALRACDRHDVLVLSEVLIPRSIDIGRSDGIGRSAG